VIRAFVITSIIPVPGGWSLPALPADPARPEKQYELAQAVAGEVPLLVLKGVDPSEVPLGVNAVNAVLVTSERETFGPAVLEALACDVPVLATPVGIAPDVIARVEGSYCAAHVVLDELNPLRPANRARAASSITSETSRLPPRRCGRRAPARQTAARRRCRAPAPFATWEHV
jgi:glycosyltransferase involved in cell wall biosynthesis